MSAKKFFVVYGNGYEYARATVAVAETFDTAKRLVRLMHPTVEGDEFDRYIDEVPMVMFKWPHEGDESFGEVR